VSIVPIVNDASAATDLRQLLLEDIAALRARRAGQPVVIGLCGAQGSGKSTICAALEASLRETQGASVAVLSIDDLYLPAAERVRLAQSVHPLLRTRGVPGTHEVALGIGLIDRLTHAAADERTPLPRFDKLADDRLPTSAWPQLIGRADVVLLEGWCVGARAQPVDQLAAPINQLERDEDSDARWRHYVNTQLAGAYQGLFGLIDRLILLRAPGFEVVFQWRRQQEYTLAHEAAALAAQAAAAQTGPGTGTGAGSAMGTGAPVRGVMNDAQLERFISHYERLTRYILTEMPGRADIVVSLDAARRVTTVTVA
jgi:D-glycerate 3-kinase